MTIMILHIPHASTDLAGRAFQCDIGAELYRMTDHRTDELFYHPKAVRIVFPMSRLVCDVERFADDAQEAMAKKGMGVCYTTSSFGQVLRQISEAEKSIILEDYYWPHHTRLVAAVNDELQQRGSSLIVDCHSFSAVPLPHENNQDTPRPDICVGTDDYHTPTALTELVTQYFESCGYSVAVNNPFAGALVPLAHYQANPAVNSIMIEVNRDLYQADFEAVKQRLNECLSLLVEY